MLILAAWPVACAHGAERIIWKLGEVDRSDHEFAVSPDLERTGPVVLRVDDKQAGARKWPRFHPGSGNGALGGRAHTFTLAFELAAPQGVCYLDLSLLFRQPRVPAVEVAVNGHRGRFYFDPDPMFELGSGDDQFNPIRSAARRRIALPARLFRAGENLLAITAVDDPPVVIDSRNVGGRGDSGFYYDALSLSQDPDAAVDEKLDVELTPTVFFPATDQGVREECWLTVRHPGSWPGGSARVALDGFEARIGTARPAEFGEARYQVLIPGDARPGTIQIDLTAAAGAGPDGGTAARPQTFRVSFVPGKRWKLFYAPSAHLDIGYTDYRPKVAEVHARNLDRLLDVFVTHPEYRFNLDGSWIAEQWLESRSPEQASRLARHARAGRIGMNAFYASMVTAYPSLETLFRSLYPSKQVQDRYGIPLEFALTTDIPSNCWSVPSLLASAGIRYFASGGNQDRGPMIVYGHWSVRSPFWWEGPDGGRVLAWFSSHYHQLKALFGLPPALESGRGGVARFLRTYEQAGYAPDAVLIYGTEVENQPLDYADAEFVRRWNATYAYTRIIPCRFSEFFRYIEEHHSDQLPVVRGDGGSYWADEENCVVASTARDHENQVRAVSAEALATLAVALNPALRFPRELDQAIWRNILLYCEHTYGPARGGSQPEHDETIGQLQDKFDQTRRAEGDIDRLLRRGMSQLADQILTDGRNLVVFNPLSYERGALVRFQADGGTTLTDLATGRPVDYEVVSEKDGALTNRFWAADVPPLGYKVYRLGKGPSRLATPAAPAGDVVENRFYKVTLDPARAAVKSVYDKELGRELVDPASPYLLNEYLYVSATGPGRTRYVAPWPWLPDAEITVHHPEGGTPAAVEQTPWGRKIRLTASAHHTPRIETEILLPDAVKRIELRNSVRVDLLTREKQACYFAFPWALSGPAFRIETPNGFVNPDHDLLDGACSEWFVSQGWVNADDGKASVDLIVVDAPLVCLGDIYRGRWPRRFAKRSPSVFSYALTNCWSAKWAGEKSGEFVYRYAITSGRRFDPVRAARLGRAARCPLEVSEVKPSDKLPGSRAALPPAQASFMSLAPENLVATAFKPAEDGEGLVVRLLEIAGRESEGVLRLPFLTPLAASEASAVEVPGKALKCDASGVHFAIKPYQALTVRLTMKPPSR
jgi:hypothetical protein